MQRNRNTQKNNKDIDIHKGDVCPVVDHFIVYTCRSYKIWPWMPIYANVYVQIKYCYARKYSENLVLNQIQIMPIFD